MLFLKWLNQPRPSDLWNLNFSPPDWINPYQFYLWMIEPKQINRVICNRQLVSFSCNFYYSVLTVWATLFCYLTETDLVVNCNFYIDKEHHYWLTYLMGTIICILENLATRLWGLAILDLSFLLRNMILHYFLFGYLECMAMLWTNTRCFCLQLTKSWKAWDFFSELNIKDSWFKSNPADLVFYP